MKHGGNFLPLIRGRVLVLRGQGSSTLSVDKWYVNFRTLLRVIGTSPQDSAVEHCDCTEPSLTTSSRRFEEVRCT